MIKSNIKISISTLFFFLTTVILSTLLFFKNSGENQKREYDSSAILSRISHIQELALLKHHYTGVVGYKDYMKFLNLNIPLTDKYFLLKYDGYIKAGVDFANIRVSVKSSSIVYVSIPKPTILECVIDEESVEVYNESENAFNPIKIADYNEAIIREKSAMRDDAISRGILKDAAEQAEMLLQALLREMGFSDIFITEELTMPSLN